MSSIMASLIPSPCLCGGLQGLSWGFCPVVFRTALRHTACGNPRGALSCHTGRYHTIALAGTYVATGSVPQWSDKNLHEQQYVAQYIESCLARYSDDIQADGPYTAPGWHPGNICVQILPLHSLAIPKSAPVLHALHPTPAVCGVPKREAHQFILDNEDLDRSYYSGFSVLSTSMATLPCLSRCAACASWTIVIACLPVEESCRRVSNRWSGTEDSGQDARYVVPYRLHNIMSYGSAKRNINILCAVMVGHGL